MINIQQFRTLVVRPVLESLAAYNPAMHTPTAENLLIGTAVQESRLTYLAQLGGGPALGVMQIEPDTHDDVWTNFLVHRADLSRIMTGFALGGAPGAEQLPSNLAYSVAVARLVYWRAREPMPSDPDDVEALAAYWKAHYNTAGGAGTVDEFVENYHQIVKGGA